MRLQHLVAEVNRPFEEINYPGMCGDHRLCLNRKGQQPERTDTTVKHKKPARLSGHNYPTISCCRQAFRRPPEADPHSAREAFPKQLISECLYGPERLKKNQPVAKLASR